MHSISHELLLAVIVYSSYLCIHTDAYMYNPMSISRRSQSICSKSITYHHHRCITVVDLTSSSSSSVIVKLKGQQHHLVRMFGQPLALIQLLIIRISALSSPIMLGGLLSGALHAISGPDHLAAVLPPAAGKSGAYGLRLGALWGLGHGCTAIILGLCAFFLKGTMSNRFRVLQKLSTIADSTVGLSLIFIGILGIKENLEVGDVIDSSSKISNSVDNINSSGSGSSSSSSSSSSSISSMKSAKAIFFNGLLHGFSIDGAPSLAPALAATSLKMAVTFLLSYCIGTMMIMSIAAGAFGEGSIRLGQYINNPNLPRNLSLVSSIVALFIGIIWVVKAVI